MKEDDSRTSMPLGKPMISSRLPKAFSQPKHLNQKKIQEHHQDLSAANEFKNVKKLLSPLKQSSSKNSALNRALNKLSFFPSGLNNTPSNNIQLDMLLQNNIKLNEMLTISILKSSYRSGIVKKSLHAPTLHLYANKEVPVSTFNTRQKLLDTIKAWQNIQKAARYLVEVNSSFWNSPEGCVTIVMEYMAGDSLYRLCENIGAIPERILKSITRRILAGLSYHHKKIGPHGGIDLNHIMFTRYGKAKLGLGLTSRLNLKDDNNSKKPATFADDIYDFGVTLLSASLGSSEWSQECLQQSGDCCVYHSSLKNSEIPYISRFSPKFSEFLCLSTRFSETSRGKISDLVMHEWLKSDECVGADVVIQDLLCLSVSSSGRENVYNTEKQVSLILESLQVILTGVTFRHDVECVKELAKEFGVNTEYLEDKLKVLQKSE